MNKSLLTLCLVCSLVAIMATGCRGRRDRAPRADRRGGPQATENFEPVVHTPKMSFKDFKKAELRNFVLAERHARNEGNRKSASTMDEGLTQRMNSLFPDLRIVALNDEFSKNAPGTLLIEPYIRDIRLVKPGSRVMLGAMAGGSHIMIQVIFRDGATGQSIASPEFRQSLDGWTGGMTWGGMDMQLRDKLVQQIFEYTSNQMH